MATNKQIMQLERERGWWERFPAAYVCREQTWSAQGWFKRPMESVISIRAEHN